MRACVRPRETFLSEGGGERNKPCVLCDCLITKRRRRLRRLTTQGHGEGVHIEMSHFSVLAAIALAAGELCLNPMTNEPILTCTRCLWQPGCVWCPHRPFSDQPAVGCLRGESSTCPTEEKKADFKVLKLHGNKELGKGVQLSPQSVRLLATPNQEASVKFTVSPADMPVDIYFVMDLSGSMEKHKDNLVLTAEDIHEKVKSLTTHYRFGFGSFSDKPTPPYSQKAHWAKKGEAPPYAFQHHVDLTDDIKRFKAEVGRVNTTANIDPPESGLDALMQAMTCKDDIGWSEDVRKVIIYVTDVDAHFAYDGRRGGIVRPQDGRCHLDSDSKYTEELRQDFPSFGQIRDQLQKRNVVVVFAVGPFAESFYSRLSFFLQGEENIGRLDVSTSSLQEIVTAQYRKIKSRVSVEVSKKPMGVEVSLTSDCDKPSGPSTCLDVSEAQEVNYVANFVLTKEACESKKPLQATLALSGFPKDSLTVQIKCKECECGARKVQNSTVCSSSGDMLSCGGCACYEGFSGEACKCNKATGSYDHSKSCISNGEECGGRGLCKCGRCHCYSQYLGDFCKCERDRCPRGRPQALLGGHRQEPSECSGHGECQCDEATGKVTCDCRPGWTGKDCSCPPPKQVEHLCRDKRTRQNCFGRGDCECGRCRCHDGFEGKFCQKERGRDVCSKLEPCILAHQFKPVDKTDEDQDSVVSYWDGECKAATTLDGYSLFDPFIYVSCPVQEANSTIIYKEASPHHNCGQMLKEYGDFLNLTKNDANSTRNVNRGDDFGIKPISTRALVRCIGYHEDCEFVYYHDNLDSDEYYEEAWRPGNVYVVHRDVNGTWKALTTCSVVPMAVILVSTLGTLTLFFIGLIVAGVVIVNINDLRRWQQYQAWKVENERRLGSQQSNPLYQKKATAAATTTVQNPMFSSDNDE